MFKKQILALLVCINSITPIATYTVSVSSLTTNTLAKMRYMKRNISNAWYSLFALPISRADREKILQDYAILNNDPLANPIIESILQRYDVDAMGIIVLENKCKENSALSITNMNGRANDAERIILLSGYTMSEAIRDKSHIYYPCAEGILAHEIGHIVDHTIAKLNIFRSLYFSIVAISVFQAFVLTRSTMIDVLTTLGTVALNQYCLNSLVTRLYYSYFRYRERTADYHVIEHANDPRVLWQMAQYFKDNAVDDLEHPSCAERAAYFEKAAQELEEKIAREN